MGKRAQIKKVLKFLNGDIFRVQLENIGPLRAFLIRQLKVGIIALRGFKEDRVQLRASALTFYTILSLVPVLALIFGIASGFGFENYLEKELSRVFAGREEVLEMMLEFTRSLLDATKGGLMAVIGIVILLWSVMNIMGQIELSFNDIWQVHKSRTFVRKFADFFSLIIIAPILIVLANAVTVYLLTSLNSGGNSAVILSYLNKFLVFLIKFSPYLLIWLLFTIIYMVMPNTRVKFIPALLAGILAGTLFQVTQWGYIHFQVGVSRYNAIYGSFAALPLLLMWMQISWLIVLMGAEISFAYQNYEEFEFEADTAKMSTYNRRLLAIYVAHLLVRNFASEVSPLTAKQISDELRLPVKIVLEALNDLTEAQVISETKTRYIKEIAYQPAIDINKITIAYITDKLDNRGGDINIKTELKPFAKLNQIMSQFSKAVREKSGTILLKDIQ